MGDFLWFFGVLVFIVYSISANKKISKKLQETPAPEPDFEGPEVSDVLFKPMMAKDAMSHNEEKSLFSNYKSVESLLSQEQVIDKKEEDIYLNTNNNLGKNPLAEDFDIRKAVIYAEIMNPKFKE